MFFTQEIGDSRSEILWWLDIRLNNESNESNTADIAVSRPANIPETLRRSQLSKEWFREEVPEEFKENSTLRTHILLDLIIYTNIVIRFIFA